MSEDEAQVRKEKAEKTKESNTKYNKLIEDLLKDEIKEGRVVVEG
ncbi:hypothetical protein AGMMS49983_20510 [Clostridia bacterium]|nr:hypothetical protein AGMMS49983_20510 [Clostridia bacterium]